MIYARYAPLVFLGGSRSLGDAERCTGGKACGETEAYAYAGLAFFLMAAAMLAAAAEVPVAEADSSRSIPQISSDTIRRSTGFEPRFSVH